MKPHKYLKHLRDSNPSKVWIQELFQTSLDLINGEHIIVRFDAVSTDSFTADMAASLIQGHILDDDMQKHIEKNPALSADCYEVWDAIADSLNAKMRMILGEVMEHAEISFKILDALSAKDYDSAYNHTLDLGVKLVDYEPRASTIWDDWVGKVLHVIKTGNEPGSGVDTAI